MRRKGELPQVVTSMERAQAFSSTRSERGHKKGRYGSRNIEFEKDDKN